MFPDILSHLASLSCVFRRQSIDFTIVKFLVTGTKAIAEALLLTPRDFFSSLPTVLKELEWYGVCAIAR